MALYSVSCSSARFCAAPGGPGSGGNDAATNSVGGAKALSKDTPVIEKWGKRTAHAQARAWFGH